VACCLRAHGFTGAGLSPFSICWLELTGLSSTSLISSGMRPEASMSITCVIPDGRGSSLKLPFESVWICVELLSAAATVFKASFCHSGMEGFPDIGELETPYGEPTPKPLVPLVYEAAVENDLESKAADRAFLTSMSSSDTLEISLPICFASLLSFADCSMNAFIKSLISEFCDCRDLSVPVKSQIAFVDLSLLPFFLA